MRRLGRMLFNALTVLSLLLCAATVAVWVRSYWRTDLVALNSAGLHRAVSGGGGLFLEGFDLVQRNGSWRDPSAPKTQVTRDYSGRRATLGGGARRWEWETRPYQGRAELVKRAWGPDLNRALPQVHDVDQSRRQTFNNVDGSVVVEALVGRRVWVPYWLPFIATAALPLVRALGHVRGSRRSRLNLCAA